MTSTTIKLTPGEELIFDSLPKCKLLLCCGGWVRDKLQGEKANDLDFVVDREGFSLLQIRLLDSIKAQAASKNWKILNERQKMLSLDRGVVSGSQLLTVSVTLFDSDERQRTFDMDFRELRQGTSEHEDVVTRDFTVNSMYFDPRTRHIIDLKTVGYNNC